MPDKDRTITDIVSEVSTDNLKSHVKMLEGLRHGWENYEVLEEKASYVENYFRSLGLQVSSDPVLFHGKSFRNIVAEKPSDNVQGKGCILLGAHYDSPEGSPGADDNASGVAVLLETARILSKLNIGKSLKFVAFTLEEPQPHTMHFLIGSRHFAEQAKKAGDKYDAVLILESVGFVSHERGSQIIPSFVRVIAPDTGNFLGIVANKTSEAIMNSFERISREFVPELPVMSYKAPFSGYFMPETRFSDHSPFWDSGYPALMLTDTAMFRNPYYHTENDRFETLDFDFMSNVAKAVVSFIAKATSL